MTINMRLKKELALKLLINQIGHNMGGSIAVETNNDVYTNSIFSINRS